MNTSLRIPAALVASAAIVLAFGASAVRASDEGKDVAVKVKATLEAAACTGSPATVTLLGLNIDVTKAKFEVGDDGDDDGDDGRSNPGACTELIPGARVEAKLVDDIDPLTALEVEQEGDDDDDGSELQAPLQAVDPASGQITVLGLNIDASAAALDGEDDDCDEDGAQPLDLSQLTLGQFVEVHLDESKLPALVASRLEVKNFTNQIEIDLEDEHGEDIDDDSPTVKADAAVTVVVKIPARKGQRARVVRQTVHINQTAKRPLHPQRSPEGRGEDPDHPRARRGEVGRPAQREGPSRHHPDREGPAPQDARPVAGSWSARS